MKKSRNHKMKKLHTRKIGKPHCYKKRESPSKIVPWAGWHTEAPYGAARTRMYRKCGSKCFLGKKTPKNRQHPNFPICTKGTCDVNTKGLWAAYIRAKQWGNKQSTYKGRSEPRLKRKTYKRIADKARIMLNNRGFYVGK